MSNRPPAAVPDAWDDDWENLADREISTTLASPEDGTQAPKSERKSKHVEANRELWESAESTPDRFLFLETKDSVPLRSDFKAPVKVLSRKPKPGKTVLRNGQPGIVGSATPNDDDDSGPEAVTAAELTPAERQQKAQREREEKQRKYMEVRERLFGSSTPDNSQPQPTTSKGEQSAASRVPRGKIRSKIGQDHSSSEPSPARGKSHGKQLFDPSNSPKPAASQLPRREDFNLQGKLEAAKTEQPIRMPRGPDGSGRGGFGFAPRGAKSNADSDR